MTKLIFVRPDALLKSHVEGYTRKDGTPVKPHDDKRVKKAPDEKYSHPHAVGKAELTDHYAEGAHDASTMKFAGTHYNSTGKDGKSFHDETPVREFESEDGHRVWMDHHSRVHADSKGEVEGLRAKADAHASGRAEASSKTVDNKQLIELLGDNVQSNGAGLAPGGSISIPPHVDAAGRISVIAGKIKDLGFKEADGGRPIKHGQGSVVLANDAGQKVTLTATDAGDKTRISLSVQTGAGGADKPAGGDEAAEPASHAQKQQDADDAAYTGEAEKEDYGVYHKPGSKVEDRKGEKHVVAKHRGPEVTTEGGKTFHPTKLSPIAEDDGEGLGGGPAKGHRARAKAADTEAGSMKALEKHPMHSPSDLEYFKSKGYTAKQIKEVWDRDHAAGHKPVEHKKAPDVVGVAADPDHYKKQEKGGLFKSLADGVRLLLKSDVAGYSRKDGTMVAPHHRMARVEGANRYEFTHGKKPRGSGSWMFSKHPEHDFGAHSDDELFTHNGSFTEAKDAASKWGRDKGHAIVHLQT